MDSISAVQGPGRSSTITNRQAGTGILGDQFHFNENKPDTTTDIEVPPAKNTSGVAKCSDRRYYYKAAELTIKVPAISMLQRALHWLITISLVAHSLSLTIVMSSAHANGLWTISCAGKPMLLPIPGETDDSNPMGHCLYCCSDSPETSSSECLSSVPHPGPGAAAPLSGATSTDIFQQFAACHPTRAPPITH